MVKTTQEIYLWLDSMVGKPAKDYDGCAGIQCPDLLVPYLRECFGLPNFVTYDGRKCAEQVAKQFPKYFEYFPYSNGLTPQVGDIVSFHSSSSPAHGHVGMVICGSDASGYYYLLEQWSTSGTIRRTGHEIAPPQFGVSYTIIGIARPKNISGGDVIQTPQKPTASIFPAGTVLKRTKTNDKELVKILQNVLNLHGKYGLIIDGSFGPLTEKAVKDFQKKNGLEVDGSVGPKTISALNGV